MFKFCIDITHQYSIYPPKAKSYDIWHLAFGIVILFLNQEVIVATWPVSHDVQVIVEKRNVNTKERVFFSNQEVIVATWPVSQEVQARNLLNTGSPFPRGSKSHILGMSRVTNCAVFWTLFKRGVKPAFKSKVVNFPWGSKLHILFGQLSSISMRLIKSLVL